MLEDIILEFSNWLSDHDSFNLFKINKKYYKCLSKYKFKEYYEINSIKNYKFFYNVNKIICYPEDNISKYHWITNVVIGMYNKFQENDIKNLFKIKESQCYRVPKKSNEEFKLPHNTKFLAYMFNIQINFDNLKYLVLPNSFNSKIKFPETLTHLKVGNLFNQEDVEWPSNLEYLCLGEKFNQSLSSLKKLFC